MIKIEKLSVGYGKKNVCEDIDLVFEKGEITVILGSNGSGKTTLLRSAAGLIPRSSGEISVLGRSIDEYAPRELAKKLSYMPQTRHVPSMNVESYLMCARYPYIGINGSPSQADREAVERAIAQTGLEGLRHRPVKKLSGGEKQKVYFAFLLAQGTEIVLLDEPTSFLDVARKRELLFRVEEMKKMEKTVVCVLHDIAEALKLADKLVLLFNGRILACGTPLEVLESKMIEKVYGVKIHCAEIDGRKEYLVL